MALRGHGENMVLGDHRGYGEKMALGDRRDHGEKMVLRAQKGTKVSLGPE